MISHSLCDIEHQSKLTTYFISRLQWRFFKVTERSDVYGSDEIKVRWNSIIDALLVYLPDESKIVTLITASYLMTHESFIGNGYAWAQSQDENNSLLMLFTSMKMK